MCRSCRMGVVHEFARAKVFVADSLLCTWFIWLVVRSALVRCISRSFCTGLTFIQESSSLLTAFAPSHSRSDSPRSHAQALSLPMILRGSSLARPEHGPSTTHGRASTCRGGAPATAWMQVQPVMPTLTMCHVSSPGSFQTMLCGGLSLSHIMLHQGVRLRAVGVKGPA